jgi:Zn-dependent peptidase ImmA (M78 family)/DNA-binding XRE family transcriptional regulator
MSLRIIILQIPFRKVIEIEREGFIMASVIGARIKALREERKLSQDDLARLFGFKDRQTVSAIETGERRVTAEELILAVEKLGAPLDYFTDPFLLVGEGRFNWRRQSDVGGVRLDAYERNAGRWISAFRVIAPQVGRNAPLLRRSLPIARQQTFEDAMQAGERFVAEFELGDVPAARLIDVMERKLGILVLMVDAFKGISGAACRLPDLDVVLINRHEVVGRRNFDLAHELFHILTWDAMPPEHTEEARETGGNRVEQLANNFASAVLMPKRVLERFGDWSTLAQADLPAKLNAAAEELQVTASALKWRLVALDRLKPAVARAVPDAALRNNGRGAVSTVPPPLFSKPFMEVIALAVEEGRVSARRAAALLDLTIDDLADLFQAHGVQSPVEL